MKSRRSRKSGLPPGSPVHVGPVRTHPVKITVIDYNERDFTERDVDEVNECIPYGGKDTVTWVNVDGIHDVKLVESVGSCFHLHPLLVEDIVNTEQRPKTEDFGDYMSIILKMLQLGRKRIEAEQVTLVIGEKFVISLQENEGDVFEPVRTRLREGKGKMRKMGPDYLAYSLIDAIVDNYFLVLEEVGEWTEDMERKLVVDPKPQTLPELHSLKRDLVFLRRIVWPLREVIAILEKTESPLIKKNTKIYLRDVYDHTIQIIDTIETYRDLMSGMVDIYLSSISNRMNEVMKVLTVIATIFIPLTFVTGWYGMNFEHMPELGWRYGYPLVLTVMFALGAGMYLYFKRKGWM